MRTEFHLQTVAKGRMVGARALATPLRQRVEIAIADGAEVVIDFDDIEATQSFIDELVGLIILRHGPSILERLVFRRCTSSVQAIMRFVAADRADQYSRAAH